MLDDLVQTIETLQERIAKHAAELGRNEIRTRTVLIDPLLKALGWDVADPSVVSVEFEAGNGRADYGLLRGSNAPPVVLVEAKKLNEPLSSHVGQLLTYALERGVPYGCLTDGNKWEVYDVFRMVPMEERIKLSVAISTSETAKAALAILGLWRKSLKDGSFEEAAEPLLETIETPAPLPPALPSVVATLPTEASPPPSSLSPGWKRLTDGSFTHTQPEVIRLPDGSAVDASSWAAAMRVIAEWLRREGKLTPALVATQLNGKAFISSDGKQLNGKSYSEPYKIADGIVLSMQMSADNHARNARTLLTACGYDPSSVHVKVQYW